MRNNRRQPRAFTLLELLVVISITGIFVAATAPVMQEMLTSLRSIQSREARDAAQDTWVNLLRADLWAGRQVTLQSPCTANHTTDIVIPAANPQLPPVTWSLDPQTAITRTTTPTPDSDGIKTFQPHANAITLQLRDGSLRLTITQSDVSQPTLHTLPVQTRGTP